MILSLQILYFVVLLFAMVAVAVSQHPNPAPGPRPPQNNRPTTQPTFQPTFQPTPESATVEPTLAPTAAPSPLATSSSASDNISNPVVALVVVGALVLPALAGICCGCCRRSLCPGPNRTTTAPMTYTAVEITPRNARVVVDLGIPNEEHMLELPVYSIDGSRCFSVGTAEEGEVPIVTVAITSVDSLEANPNV
jgi:hypothetical protein